MQLLSTRMASIMLAFGIFFTISCTGLKNTDADPSTSNTTDSGSFERELARLNEQIQNNSNNGQFRLNKAELLVTHAQTLTPPSSRLPVYKHLTQTADEARSQTPGVSGRIQAVVERAWSAEYNDALRLVQKSPQASREDYSAITAHLTNSVNLSPANIDSYRLLATIQYTHGYYPDAIQTVQDALSVISDKEDSILFQEKLAYLYLESGSGDEAIAIYRDIAAEQPDRIQFRHGLVNALIVSGYHEEAVLTLKELMEEHPSRVSYQEILAVENYHYFSKKYEALLNGSSSDIDPEELVTLLETSNEIYRSLEEDAPMRQELTFSAARFYKEAAQKLEQLAGVRGLNENNLNQIISDYRNSALQYWERLANINPDNTEYMYNLYELYVSLDLTDEARQLEETYNFN